MPTQHAPRYRVAPSAVAALCALLAAPPATCAPAIGVPGASLDQCVNGPIDAPTDCMSLSAWVNGNVNQNQAHWFEGESPAFRLRFANLAVGPSHTVVLEWDTTVVQDALAYHAFDYLTSYDRTVANADPCDGVSGCDAQTTSTRAIPTDPWVTRGPDGVAGTLDDIVQVPGHFTLYGGTIDSVGGYVRLGDYAGASSTSVAVTFTASVSYAVLAWGAHVAESDAWGRAALSIPGSPYHLRFLELDGMGGNQDRAIASTAVYAFPRLHVYTVVVNDDGGSAAPGDFTLTVTGTNPVPASFPGSAGGTRVVLGEGSYAVHETGPPGYAVTYSAACSGVINVDMMIDCTVTNDDAPRPDLVFADGFETPGPARGQ